MISSLYQSCATGTRARMAVTVVYQFILTPYLPHSPNNVLANVSRSIISCVDNPQPVLSCPKVLYYKLWCTCYIVIPIVPDYHPLICILAPPGTPFIGSSIISMNHRRLSIPGIGGFVFNPALWGNILSHKDRMNHKPLAIMQFGK